MTVYLCLCATLEHDPDAADLDFWDKVRADSAPRAAEKFCADQSKQGHIKPRQEVLVRSKTEVTRFVVRQKWEATQT